LRDGGHRADHPQGGQEAHGVIPAATEPYRNRTTATNNQQPIRHTDNEQRSFNMVLFMANPQRPKMYEKFVHDT
ncbi:hypothetical protein, partial [Bifidobacterium longum]|uniref:hypothetical protein n=1 Tax=Bifidobacterium longum TaxID=216816 RepID=UPI0020252677